MGLIVNAWICYKEYYKKLKLALKTFLVNLAEQLCAHGSPLLRKSAGRPSTFIRTVGKHEIKKVLKRRRYVHCKKNQKKEIRVRQIYVKCNVGLYINCFDAYHNTK